MMKNILNLTRLFLKAAGSTQKKKIGYYLLLAFVFIYFGAIIYFGAGELIDLLIEMKQPTYFIGLIIIANATMPILQGILTSLNLMYFSKDNSAILPLPVKPAEILAAKLNVILIYNLITNTILGIMPLVYYGIKTSAQLLYYPLAIITIMLVPVVSVMIAAVIIILLMYVLRNIRNKTIVQTITTVLTLLGVMTFSFLTSSSGDATDLLILAMRSNKLIESLEGIFPTVTLAINVLVRSKYFSLLLLAVVSAAAYLLVVFVFNKPFMKGFVGALFSSAGVSHKKLNDKTAFKSKGLMFSYVTQEWKNYLRRPNFVINLVIPGIILPVFMVVVMFVSINQAGEGMDLIGELASFYDNPLISPYITIGLLCALFFFTSYSFLSMVAISKDGTNALFTKQIPVPFYKQIIYKAIPDIMMVLVISVLVLAPIIILFRIPLSIVAPVAVIIIPYSILHGAMILIDLHKPKLHWTNDLQVVKQNFRILWSLGLGFLNIAITLLLMFKGVEPVIIYGILFSVYTILSAVAYVYIKNKDFELAKNIL